MDYLHYILPLRILRLRDSQLFHLNKLRTLYQSSKRVFVNKKVISFSGWILSRRCSWNLTYRNWRSKIRLVKIFEVALLFTLYWKYGMKINFVHNMLINPLLFSYILWMRSFCIHSSMTSKASFVSCVERSTYANALSIANFEVYMDIHTKTSILTDIRIHSFNTPHILWSVCRAWKECSLERRASVVDYNHPNSRIFLRNLWCYANIIVYGLR
jgi:hypothetical protein